MKKQLAIVLAVAVLTINTSAPIEAFGYSNIRITVNDMVIAGLEQVKYQAANGDDILVDFNTIIAEYDGRFYNTYFLEDPHVVERLPQEQDIPSYLDSDSIIAILSLKELITLDDILAQTGCAISANEYVAATQIAISLVVAQNSQSYKIDASSVKNQNVLDAAYWLVGKSKELVSSKPINTSIFDHIWEVPTMSVNSSKAKGNIEGLFNYYGPYTIESTDLTLIIAPTLVPTNYALTTDINGEVVQSVRVNDPFYIRFDNQLISDISIEFRALPILADMRTFGNHVFLFRGYRIITTQLMIGNQSRVGKVHFLKYDGLTNAAIPGTVVELRDKSGNFVTSLTTNDKGEVLSPDLQVGDYTLKEVRATSGYLLDATEHPVEINGNGSIVNIVSEARPVDAILNFVASDVATSAPVGGSIFEIVDTEGEVVTRIGFSDTGRCSNIRLDEGRYYLRETSTHLSYQLNTYPIYFDAIAGETTEIKIEKTSAFNYVSFELRNQNNEVITSTALDLWDSDGSFITTLKTDNHGGLTISLPAGSYHVTSTTGQTQAFSVSTAEQNVQVLMEMRTYSGVISGVVTDSNGDPVASVKLIGVSDEGVEYGSSTTNFEGIFELVGVPDNAIIFVMVESAPFGYTGETTDNRVLMLESTMKRDLIIYTLDEVNAQLPEDEQLIQYHFYEEGSGSIPQPILKSNSSASGMNAGSSISGGTNSSEVIPGELNIQPNVTQKKSISPVIILGGFIAVLGGFVFLIFKKKGGK